MFVSLLQLSLRAYLMSRPTQKPEKGLAGQPKNLQKPHYLPSEAKPVGCLAIVGATGLVGRKMLQLLSTGYLPHDQLLLAASPRSVGKPLDVQGKAHTLLSLEEVVAAKPDIALLAAGGDVARTWAPRLVAVGTRVVDNSSAFRMDAAYKLIVPEVNGELLTTEDYLVANPNCSTIQLVMALAPLQGVYGLQKVQVATYQAVTGSGQAGLDQLRAEQAGTMPQRAAYPHPITENALPHIDVFLDNGYTKEEMKLMQETGKILGQPALQVSATAVRIPTVGGHGMAVQATFNNPVDVSAARALLAAAPGVVVVDDPAGAVYPLPRNADDRDEVFVGRLRQDLHCPRTLLLWIVADPLRKGAATNALQIAQRLATFPRS